MTDTERADLIDRYLSRATKTTWEEVHGVIAALRDDPELTSVALADRFHMAHERALHIRRMLEETGYVERATMVRTVTGKLVRPRGRTGPKTTSAPTSEEGLERLTLRSSNKGTMLAARSRNGGNRLYYHKDRPMHSLGQQLERLTSTLEGQLGGLADCDFSAMAGDARCERWARMLSQAKGHLSRIRNQILTEKGETG